MQTSREPPRAEPRDGGALPGRTSFEKHLQTEYSIVGLFIWMAALALPIVDSQPF